jgi:hypothetical protein
MDARKNARCSHRSIYFLLDAPQEEQDEELARAGEQRTGADPPKLE